MVKALHCLETIRGAAVEQSKLNENLARLVAKSEQDPATAARTTEFHSLFMVRAAHCAGRQCRARRG